jgi:hypothetical protein
MGSTQAFHENGEQHQKQAVVDEYVGLLVRARISRIVSVLNRSATLDVSTADRISE